MSAKGDAAHAMHGAVAQFSQPAHHHELEAQRWRNLDSWAPPDSNRGSGRYWIRLNTAASWEVAKDPRAAARVGLMPLPRASTRCDQRAKLNASGHGTRTASARACAQAILPPKWHQHRSRARGSGQSGSRRWQCVESKLCIAIAGGHPLLQVAGSRIVWATNSDRAARRRR